MNVERELILAAKELLAAERLLATEWPSERARAEYLKKHPGADKSKHTVKAPSGAPKKTPGGGESEARPTPHKKRMPTVKSLARVKKVMQKHGLDEESDEMQEMAGFKRTLGQRVPAGDEGQYYVRNQAKLKKDFLARMSPGNYESPEAFKRAKERVQKMDVSDFGKLLAAVSDEDEG